MFTNKRMLTIDDSTTIRVFLRNLLEQQGAIVDEASSGRAGLALCASGQHYDMVLLDLLLPDMDGLQVLKCYRETNTETAVVMLTGTGGIKSAMAAVRQGADGYIEKQDLSLGGDCSEFFYALDQALQHRAGINAMWQLSEVKADFYSMVTHDLRNPAGAVMLSLSLLLEDQVGPLSEEQREFISMALESAKKLLALINDYLDFAKIDAGYLRLELGVADLVDVVRASVRSATLQAHARQQSLTVDLPAEPVHARVDAERLKQVLDNLVSNAIKYAPEGGDIRVQTCVEGDSVVLRVSDTGNGIPPEHLPALFTKYHRVPGANTRFIKGTGLGLLIVKEIVEAHGGTVRAESPGIPGAGATFTVEIPRRYTPSGEAPDEE
jgi:signal transduction histidine kinase